MGAQASQQEARERMVGEVKKLDNVGPGPIADARSLPPVSDENPGPAALQAWEACSQAIGLDGNATAPGRMEIVATEGGRVPNQRQSTRRAGPADVPIRIVRRQNDGEELSPLYEELSRPIPSVLPSTA